MAASNFSPWSFSRSSHLKVFFKKMVFLKVLPNSQENTCTRVSFLIMLQASACNLIKKRLWHRYSSVIFAKFLRTLRMTACLSSLQTKYKHISNLEMIRFRSSRLQMFLKIGVLKNFANFTRKYLCLSLFLIKLKANNFVKRDCNTSVFL